MNDKETLAMDSVVEAQQPDTAMPSDVQFVSYRELLKAESEQDGLRKGARTELKIRRVVCELLEETSLHNLRVHDICELAEMSQGSFYQYFVDRDELLRSVLEGFVHFLSASMTSASRRGMAAKDATTASTRMYCVLFANNRGLMKCLLNHYESFPQARLILQDFNAKWLEAVVHNVKKRWAAIGRPVQDDTELRRRCYALGGMIDQYLTSIYLYRDPSVASGAGDQKEIVETLDFIWTKALENFPDVKR